MSLPAITLEELLPYYRGIYWATVALKGRVAKLGPEFRPAVQEISRYQMMAKRYREALEETARMHLERDQRSVRPRPHPS